MAARSKALQEQQSIIDQEKAERRIELMRIEDAKHQKLSEERWVAAGRPTAAQSIAKIKAFFAKPKPSPREHWGRVLAMPNPPHIAKQYAEEALGRSSEEALPQIQGEREPGMD